ncbi:DNA helicase MCM8-like isoform X2 [Cataglyphis hispanica]|uniref:DNA helicase MCM8-like isoform X2 n=1 Tax=Cataglyphis hispanica TaxID=1086592 RepID=UPI0021802AB3|nr:DNA helicase MCM8-like isoform X2 [Cataglyphis hispanica]
MCDKTNSHKKKWKVMKTSKQNNDVLHQNKTDHSSDNLDIGRNINIPYYGWRLFFPDSEYKSNSDITKQIEAIEAFIERHQELSLLFTMANLEAGMSFDIDICNLYEDNEFMKQWPNFKHEIHENPINTLNCMKLSIHQKILKTVPEENLQYVLNSISNLPTVKLSILNYLPIICLRDLKLNYYERLISTRGCVIRVGRIKHLIQWMVFVCSKCHLQKLVKQSQEIYTLPKKCDICGISKFYPVLDSPFVKSILFQIIRIQEPLDDEQENKGRVPKILDVELMDNLVNICMPGDDITLTGIIKIQGVEDTTKIQVGTPFSLYMKAITVINNKRKYENKSSMSNEIFLKNYLAIQNIYKEQNIFALLVHSLCPSIYGHEIVKAGLILSLFGGNVKRAQLRDGIHILLIGDPGLGKSQMLQACARISTKEPGALVLADQGCCCIDEFDKMCSQHQALLESMEQQTITVAKSGIISSFPARTSILAAANPIGGQYDKSKTVTENLNINQPILSRFDLIFLLLDKPDKHFDSLLCKHIMTVHTNSHKNFNQEVIESSTNDCSLRKKLMLPLSTEVIPQSILRTYISYARQYVKPKLSAKAAAVLQKYYLELRSKHKQFGCIPIFNRQLEAMIRLTEARAKLELRIEATESDASDVIDILRYTMTDILEDSITSRLNSDSKLTNKKIKTFIKILEEKVNVDKKQTFSTKELKTFATCKGILINDFAVLISRLNEEGNHVNGMSRFVHLWYIALQKYHLVFSLVDLSNRVRVSIFAPAYGTDVNVLKEMVYRIDA